MNKKLFPIVTLLMALLLGTAPAKASGSKEGNGEVPVKEIIFHHLGDGYGWEVPFSHVYRIPLPVIVRAEDGQWFTFSSAKLTEVTVTEDMTTGKKTEHLSNVIHNVERDGKVYSFMIPELSSHSGKVVEVFPLSDAQQAEVHAEAMGIIAKERKEAEAKGREFTEPEVESVVVPGYVYHDGKYYREYRTLDISITKNVLALIIASLLVTWMVMSLVRYYRKQDMKAPRKGMGFFELLVSFVYNDTIKPTLGSKSRKFAPYLLTCFFFILTMNLLGLVVIFPGGANLTGNIAITLVLALLTFIVTNIHGNKHYWKEIFWPDVPIWLKFPIPIMQLIEVFGIFTKPAALCVRLFANMMGGHMIVITLTLLIFIFAAFGAAALGGSLVVSIIFSLFMLALDVLVSFIQAYVFTTLSTMFISMSVADHEHEAAHEEGKEVATATATETK